MHGDKRWIYDYKGRLKKSSDRTFKDWRGDLNNYSWKRGRSEEDECQDCKERREHIGRWVYRHKYDCDTKEWSWDTKKVFYYPYFDSECEYHRWKQDVAWHGYGFPDGYHKIVWSGHGIPSWFRRGLNRKYRTRVNQIMQKAKYDEDLYDMIPDQKPDAGWLWW